MEIVTIRFDNTSKACKSLLFLNGEFFCFTLEDPVRLKKIPKVTAIPKGKYEITFREEPSPLTQKYREKYSWFNFHLWIRGVPDYNYVYLHVGNNADHSDGCLLLNNISYADADNMGQSADTFRKFYTKVKAALERGEKVSLEIRESGFVKPLDELKEDGGAII